MAKANWLTISPMSGTGNATIRNIGSEHTGRLDRITTVTGKAVGVASEKTYSVVQHAKSEFVAVNDASYQVAATGGTVTVSGTSNSPLLTVIVDEGGTVGTLTVNGSQATNGQNISGDPGADAQYTWQVQIQVAENPIVNQRSLTVKVQGSSSSIADTIEVVQAASSFTYEYVSSASVSTIAASGGNSVVSAQLKTYRNGSLVSTQTVTPILTGSATGFSISGATVTAANRGTTVGEARSITVTCNYVTSETGETLSDTVTISQAANSRVIVYGKPTITSFEVADIPASGGSVSSGDVEYSQSRHYYYDSGQTEELSSLTTGGQVTFGDAVSVGSLGTTVKSRTIVGQLTCQVAMNGQTSVEGDASVYQQANSATYGDVSLTVTSPVSVSGGGGQYSITASGSQTVSFTSGASRAGSVSLSYTQASAVDGFSLNGSTVTANGNTTTSTKSYTVNVTATGEGSKTATKQVVFNQVAGQRTYSEITVNLSYPQASAAGGTVNPTLTYFQTWGWNGSTTGGGTITSGASVSYSGTNVNASTGVATVASKGATVSGVTTATTATVTVSMNGKTGSDSQEIYQEANEIVGEYLVDNDGYIYLGNSFSFINPTTIEIDSNYKAGYGEYGIGLEFTSGARYQPSSLKDVQQKYLEWYYDVEANINDVFSFVGDGVVCVDETAPQLDSNSEVNRRLCVSRDCAVAENEGSTARTGYFQWRWSHISTFTTPKVTVSQEKGVYLNVTPASLSFEASGGTETITIDTNESWTIS